jgi:hypothetical protein
MIDIQKLREISQNDLALLGVDVLAYIRPITLAEETVFAVNTADGRQIAITDDFEAAIAAAQSYSYQTVYVH